MAYIGNTAPSRFVSNRAASVYSGDGSTVAFTLEQAVVQDEDILVSVDGVIQEPSVAYAVSSGTTLTFTAAPSSNSGNNIFVYYLFRTVATVDHPSTSALSATSGTFTGDLTSAGSVSSTDGGTALTMGVLSNATTLPALNFNGAFASSTMAGIYGNGATASNLYYTVPSSKEHFFSIADSVKMTLDSNGIVTIPNQPAFSVHKNNSNQNNIAINTDVTVTFGTEAYDQNGDFASNTFTAPVTGKYFLSVSLRVGSLDTAASFVSTQIKTSNRTYKVIIDPNFSADLDYFTQTATIVADMDANDTVYIIHYQSGGTAQADIDGSSEWTYFSGYLLG